jgi:glycosyltransferase involved in cell wall biosynthesis
MPHKRLDKIQTSLAKCQRLLVHSVKDINRLKALDLVDNVTLFAHGIKEFDLQSIEQTHLPKDLHARWKIASYGFFLPHKGLLELIEACAILRQGGLDICLNMVNSEYPVPESSAIIKQAKDLIVALQMEAHVILETQFLPDAESFALLKKADMLVFPYQDTGESASGAVRYGLATGNPVVVTPIPIFEDIESVVFQLPGKTPAEIAAGIKQLITDISTTEEHVRTKLEKAQRWRHEHTYSRLGRRLCNMLFALHQAHKEN